MKHQPILIGSAQPSDNRYFDIHHVCFFVLCSRGTLLVNTKDFSGLCTDVIALRRILKGTAQEYKHIFASDSAKFVRKYIRARHGCKVFPDIRSKARGRLSRTLKGRAQCNINFVVMCVQCFFQTFAFTQHHVHVFHIDRSLTIYTAGFPCQPYSNCGKNLGHQDPKDCSMITARRISQMFIRCKWHS
jgi:hypothetical protein